MEISTARRNTRLIMSVFLLQPMIIGGWLASIPLIMADLGLSKGELSIALLGMPIALIPALQVAGLLIGRIGVRRTCRIAFIAQGAAVLLPLAAWDVATLFLALACLGASTAFLEVGMNVYAGRLEKISGLMIMNRCHGFWSLGLMIGSAAVTFVILASAAQTLIGMALATTMLGFMVTSALAPVGVDGSPVPVARRRLTEIPRALFFIGAFMFLVTLTEGVMADWAAVYLAERLGEVSARAGVAVTIFAGFMAAGRFVGDWLKRHVGAVRLAVLTVTSAIAGLCLLILPLPLAMAYPGFALVGFGVSAAYPLGVSAVAALGDSHEPANIAIMATVAMGGFLVGPPLIGFLSETFSLRVAIGMLIPGLAAALALSLWLRPVESADMGGRHDR